MASVYVHENAPGAWPGAGQSSCSFRSSAVPATILHPPGQAAYLACWTFYLPAGMPGNNLGPTGGIWGRITARPQIREGKILGRTAAKPRTSARSSRAGPIREALARGNQDRSPPGLRGQAERSPIKVGVKAGALAPQHKLRPKTLDPHPSSGLGSVCVLMYIGLMGMCLSIDNSRSLFGAA